MSTIDGREGFGNGGRSRGNTHPVCEYSFLAAQRIAHDEWHAWAADQAATARLLAETGAAGARRGRIAPSVASLRAAIGTRLIALGRRGQGAAPSPQSPPTAAPIDGAAR